MHFCHYTGCVTTLVSPSSKLPAAYIILIYFYSVLHC
jgi:hypothetical protein